MHFVFTNFSFREPQVIRGAIRIPYDIGGCWNQPMDISIIPSQPLCDRDMNSL